MNVYLLVSYSDLADSGLMSNSMASYTLKLMRSGGADKNTEKVINFVDSNPAFKVVYDFLSDSKHERIDEVLKKSGVTMHRRKTILSEICGAYTIRLVEALAIAYTLEHEADHN